MMMMMMMMVVVVVVVVGGGGDYDDDDHDCHQRAFLSFMLLNAILARSPLGCLSIFQGSTRRRSAIVRVSVSACGACDWQHAYQYTTS